MTWDELQRALYGEYEKDTNIWGFGVMVDIPGGGDYANVEIEVTGYKIDRKNRVIRLEL